MSEKLSSRVTIDHEEIKNWVEEKGGKPCKVRNEGLLRIDFNGGDKSEEVLEEISWDEFFKEFDSKRLAFLYESEGDNRFVKLIKRY